MIGKNLLENNEYLLTEEAEQRFCALISNARWVEQFIRNGILAEKEKRVALSGRTPIGYSRS